MTAPRTDTPTTLAAALVAAQVAASEPLPKGGANRHHDFRYATADSVIGAGRAILAAHGLALVAVAASTSIVDVEYADDEGVVRKDQQRTRTIAYRLMHVSGDGLDLSRSISVEPGKGRPPDKAELTADTTALAYVYRDVLGLERGDASDDVSARDDTKHEPRRTSSASGARANQHAGPCAKCSAEVAAGAGTIRKEDGKWLVEHVGECPPRPGVTSQAQADASEEPQRFVDLADTFRKNGISGKAHLALRRELLSKAFGTSDKDKLAMLSDSTWEKGAEALDALIAKMIAETKKGDA